MGQSTGGRPRRGPEVFAQIVSRIEQEPIALDPYFVASLLEQLQDEEDALAPLQSWLEERVKGSITELVRNEHIREAAEGVLTANAFGSLRVLPRLDFAKIFDLGEPGRSGIAYRSRLRLERLRHA